jgi:hypothetical protein
VSFYIINGKKMYLIKRIKEKLKNIFRDERDKLIVCDKCGKLQSLAILWDYQRCDCGSYLYDYR